MSCVIVAYVRTFSSALGISLSIYDRAVHFITNFQVMMLPLSDSVVVEAQTPPVIVVSFMGDDDYET